MKSDLYQKTESAKKTVRWSTLKLVFFMLFLAGAAAFLYGLSGRETAMRAWNAYLTNFVYWTGLAFGTFLLSPILVLTNAKWGRPVKRVAESVALFMPVSLILLLPLYIGREKVFWWVADPEPQKAFWLNTPFFFGREAVGIFVMALMGVLFIYNSVKSDLEYLGGDGGKVEARSTAQSRFASAYVILYAFILTIIAFDFMMSLHRHWYSSLFGAYYFAVSFYAGLAVMIIISTLLAKNAGLSDLIKSKQFHDLGKLLFAFCVVSGDFFYVQFLVIWYGNKPEETRYVITRAIEHPWSALAWLVLLVVFVAPFILLLLRKLKMKPVLLSLVAIWILFGVWLEKFLLVAPSLLETSWAPLGLMELLITLGWFGLFSFCVCWFLAKYPIFAVSDPKLDIALGPQEEAVRIN